nr:putative capsid [Marmot picobirnavirus]
MRKTQKNGDTNPTRVSGQSRTTTRDKDNRGDKNSRVGSKTAGKFRSRNTRVIADSEPRNNPEWYFAYPGLMDLATLIPHTWATGVPIDLTGKSGFTGAADNLHTLTAPGLLALKLAPSVGNTATSTDPINLAAQSLYSWIRHDQTGSKNYESPDLMIYVLGMASVYSAIIWLQRIYGYALDFVQENRYMPIAYAAADGVNLDNIQENLADFQFGINYLIHKAASLHVPSTITYFNRHAMLYRDIYTEGSSIKDQQYMYCPIGFYKFGLNSQGAGILNIEKLPGTSMTYDQLINYVDGLLQPILMDVEDAGTMSGDILRAFGESGLIKLQVIDNTYKVIPHFDIGVLEQFKNATIVPADPDFMFVGQQNGILTCSPTLNVDTNLTTDTTGDGYLMKSVLSAIAFDKVLTTTTASIDAKVIAESTRLMVTAKSPVQLFDTPSSESFTHNFSVPLFCGSEVPVSGLLISITPAGARRSWSFTMFEEMASSLQLANFMADYVPFKFAPRVQIFDTAGGVGSQPSELFSYDDFMILTPDELDRIHQVALLSMFNNPNWLKVE